MNASDHAHLKNTSIIIAQLSLGAMVIIGFFVVLFSSSTAMSFIASMTGTKVAYAEVPTDSGFAAGDGGDSGYSGYSDGGHSDADGNSPCGDGNTNSNGDTGCGSPPGDGGE